MNLKDYYAEATEDNKTEIDNTYMNVFLMDMNRDKFDEMDSDTFLAMVKVLNRNLSKAMTLIKSSGKTALFLMVFACGVGMFIGWKWF